MPLIRPAPANMLSNGQDDTYDDHDTVWLDEALSIVRHVVDHGHPPADVTWQRDR